MSHKQVAPPIINHQGLCPSIYPRGCNSGSPIGLGGVHLSQDRSKMYIDQGNHFQIIISKSILLTHSLSPVCKAKCFEMRPAQLIYHNLFYYIGVYVLSFGSSFACFHVFCFRYGEVNSNPPEIPVGSQNKGYLLVASQSALTARIG